MALNGAEGDVRILYTTDRQAVISVRPWSHRPPELNSAYCRTL